MQEISFQKEMFSEEQSSISSATVHILRACSHPVPMFSVSSAYIAARICNIIGSVIFYCSVKNGSKRMYKHCFAFFPQRHSGL